MLVRSDDRGTLLIGQPSHAWISGQLARAWGNERFGTIEPWEEVCLAAEQHDIGMAAWDLAPSRNPETGLPHSFTEMPLGAHLDLWTHGPRRLLRQSRYAALLTSMHGCRLYERRNLDRLAPDEVEAVGRFLAERRCFQDELLDSLRADPLMAAAARPELVARNSQLIWIWDFLSLALCLGWAPCAASEVPTSEVPVDVCLLAGGRAGRVLVDPWPFSDGGVVVRCEAQLLSGRFDADDALTEALATAPWETLELELAPA